MNLSSGVNNNRLSKRNADKTTQNESGGANNNKRKRPTNCSNANRTHGFPRFSHDASHLKSPVKKNAKSDAATGTAMATPFDSILNEIEAFDSGNRKREANRMKNDPKSEEDSGPCSSKQMPPLTPIPFAFRPLTKAELMRGEEDTTILRSILNKDGLMERILGYKMIRGRVESYFTIRTLIDLDNCVSPEYEDVSDSRDYERRHPAVPFHDVPAASTTPAAVAVHYSHTSSGRTPASTVEKHSGADRAANDSVGEPRRGPKTPPGSPPPLNRSRSASIATSGGGSSANCNNNDDDGRLATRRTRASRAALPPPPAFPTIEGVNSHSNGKTPNGKGDDSEALLRQFSEVTHTPVSQLREFIGEDLQEAMSRIDRSVLLTTLKNALKTVTVDKTPPTAGAGQRDGGGQPQSLGDGCEMEISSEYSIGRPSVEGSSQLLPPPPPPVISPPPPPPPLFGSAGRSGERSPSPTSLNAVPTVNLCAPASQFPPPLRGASTSGVNLNRPPPLPISKPSFVPTVPPPLFAPTVALPSGSFAVPPPLMQATAGRDASPPPTVIRVDLTHLTPTASTLQPSLPSGIALNSASSVQSTPKTVVNLKGKTSTLSLSTPQRPGRPRPAPTVNMDFIKSRPPPPIPEILRKNIANNEAAVPPPVPHVSPLIIPTTIAPPSGAIDVPPPLIQPTPLYKVVAPPTVPPMDLMKLVGTSIPVAPLVTQQPMVPAADTMLYIPAIPPSGFNSKAGEAKNSRPTSRMSGGPLPSVSADSRLVNTPPPKITRNVPQPLIGGESMPTTSRGPPANNFPLAEPRPSTTFQAGSYKQPLLPSPSRQPPQGGGGEPRRSLSNSDGNIFKTLMSALSTTAAAAAFAQALPQYTNLPANTRPRGPQPLAGQSGQPPPGNDTAMTSTLSGPSTSGGLSNSVTQLPKFNFANMREEDLNASIATFVRTFTSGAAAATAKKNLLNNNNGNGPSSRNRPYPPPPPR